MLKRLKCDFALQVVSFWGVLWAFPLPEASRPTKQIVSRYLRSLNNQQFAYNPNLLANFQSVLSKIDIWFWGHEHTLALYDPYMDLVRGRCVGASAVPVFTNQQQYAAVTDLQTNQNLPLPTWNPSATLGNNGTEYNNAFAIMTLNSALASVNYYQVPLLQPATQLPFTDTI